jgi:hypothetical protein
MEIKETLKLSEVGRHPLLQPDRIDDAIPLFVERANNYPLGEVLPLVAREVDKVYMDVEVTTRGGLTPMVAMGTESPIHGDLGRAAREFEAAEFREKIVIRETDLYNLRALGSKSEMLRARDLIRKRHSSISARLLNRMEWLRRQVIFDNKVKATLPDGQPFELDYHHPQYLRPALSGADLWSATGTADPVNNLLVWVEDFQRDTGFLVRKAALPIGLMKHLVMNAKFRSVATNSYSGFDGTHSAVMQNLMAMTGIPVLEEWTQSIAFSVEIVESAVATDTTIRLDNVDELEVGDTIILRTANGMQSDKRTVSAISGTTVTLNAALTSGFPRGSMVKYAKQVVPEDRILILGTMPGDLSDENSEGRANTSLISAWGELTSTLSRFENLERPKAGLFSKVIDYTDKTEVARIEQTVGIRALPNVHFFDAWMCPKVL